MTETPDFETDDFTTENVMDLDPTIQSTAPDEEISDVGRPVIRVSVSDIDFSTPVGAVRTIGGAMTYDGDWNEWTASREVTLGEAVALIVADRYLRSGYGSIKDDSTYVRTAFRAEAERLARELAQTEMERLIAEEDSDVKRRTVRDHLLGKVESTLRGSYYHESPMDRIVKTEVERVFGREMKQIIEAERQKLTAAIEARFAATAAAAGVEIPEAKQ
jgi:hypothetical protein